MLLQLQLAGRRFNRGQVYLTSSGGFEVGEEEPAKTVYVGQGQAGDGGKEQHTVANFPQQAQATSSDLFIQLRVFPTFSLWNEALQPAASTLGEVLSWVMLTIG